MTNHMSNVVALRPDNSAPATRRRRPDRGRSKFGTVTRMRSGRYQARFTCPLDDQRYVAPVTFDTAQAGWAFLHAERQRIENDPEGWVPPKVRRERQLARDAAQTAGNETFASYAARWLPRHAVRRDNELKPRTIENYRRLLDNFLVPEFGDKPMSAIDSRVIDAWYQGFQRRRPTQRRHTYQVLKTLMSAAVRDEVIGDNPCTVELVGTIKPARKVTLATERELAEIVTEMPETQRVMVLLAAWCALRFGELAELRRKDVFVRTVGDVTKIAINVERGVVRVPRGGSMVTIIGDPKTDAGERVVSVPPHLNDELLHHLAAYVGADAEALMFPASDGVSNLAPSTFYGKRPQEAEPARRGRPAKPATPGRGWYRARHLAGRDDLALHHLRHLGAVLAAHQGASIADLMNRLGHSTPGAAMRYQHASQERDAMIAESMSAAYLTRA